MEEDYYTITPEVLREFYERHYHSGNCSIFLSGKVTDDIISRVTDIFGIPFGQYQLQMPKSSFPFAAIPEKRIFTEREGRYAERSENGDIPLYSRTSRLSEAACADDIVRRLFR